MIIKLIGRYDDGTYTFNLFRKWVIDIRLPAIRIY